MNRKNRTLKSAFTFFVVSIIIAGLSSCTPKKEMHVLKIYQDDDLVETVTSQEFLSVFMKNNLSDEPLTKQGLEEYMELFINYKLKVKEAEALGMDTISSFKNELAGYRDQLAKPYLNDQSVTEKLVKEAWERMQEDVRVSHILVSLPQDPSPKDTLEAWEKISEAYNKLMNGADFGEVAAKYSDDPYAKDIPATEMSPGRKGNKGDLGYFTVFDMVYEFENAAYNTKVGEISPITRSVFGYHIVKVTDRQPAMGRALVAHVFIPHPRTGQATDSVDVEKKINEIYEIYLTEDISFEDLAKEYSQDRNNAHSGGVLRWFNVHGLVPQFVERINDMEIGDVSEPVMSMYGWHIIRLLERERPRSFEGSAGNIRQRLSKDARAQLAKSYVIKKIKDDFGFKEWPKNVERISKYIDTTIFNNKWEAEKSNILRDNKPLFRISKKRYSVADFGKWLQNRQTRTGSGDIEFFVNNRVKEFTENSLLNYKENRLEELYPDFRNLMNEYRDGILLFDLMDKKVWSKAVIDTIGLEEFYEKHKNEYQWPERVDAAVFITKDMQHMIQAIMLVDWGLTPEEVLDSLRRDTAIDINAYSGIFQRNDDILLDKINWYVGVTDIRPLPEEHPLYPGYYIIQMKEVLPPGPKELSEVRGIMISRYQEELEKNWLQYLHEKYRVEINNEALEALYKNNQ